LVLRHNPEVAELELDGQGWTGVPEVVRALRRRFPEVDEGVLRELVHTNDKQRFVVEGQRIRAVQGHSVQVDLGLTPVTPPEHLYHGTKVHHLDSIFRQGLVRGARTHVHLSRSERLAETVARRKVGAPVILLVRAGELTGPCYLTSNGVWLTQSVPPELLSVLHYPDPEKR
jgi:putative RNA 2'-phosphotransferase